MTRTLVGSLIGAAIGYFAGYVGVTLVVGNYPSADIGWPVLCVGSFLAGTGAIAGAIVGGVTELRESSGRKSRARSEGENHDDGF
jgi:gas vesicle protein